LRQEADEFGNAEDEIATGITYQLRESTADWGKLTVMALTLFHSLVILLHSADHAGARRWDLGSLRAKRARDLAAESAIEPCGADDIPTNRTGTIKAFGEAPLSLSKLAGPA
jgi:hypothetical protein